MKDLAFLLFEQMYQKKNAGSSRIRGHWLMKHMPEAEPYQQGAEYQAIIFQKAYWKEMAKHFKGKKILDICDPDWLDGYEIVSFCENMDAVTVPTEALKTDLERMVSCPVHIIKDRIDFDTIPRQKMHEGEAKTVAWFGYSHNAHVLEPALMKIKKMGLKLVVISDGTFSTGECEVINVPWNVETVNEELLKVDYVLLPEKKDGRFAYKSDNKTVQSWALGLPVARTPKDMERFISAEEREKEGREKHKIAVGEYDVKESVREMREVLKTL